MLIYLRRLRVVKPHSRGIRLGAGRQRFRVVPLGAAARAGIQGFLNMSEVLNSLPKCTSVKKYQSNSSLVFDAFSASRVIHLSSAYGVTYNRAWAFRQYQLATNRCVGIQRLRYSAQDTAAMLPGPDALGCKRRLGMKRLLTDVVRSISCYPEYACLQCCLHFGRYRMQSRLAGMSEHCKRYARCVYPCARCVASHRSAYYCRIHMWHTGS